MKTLGRLIGLTLVACLPALTALAAPEADYDKTYKNFSNSVDRLRSLIEPVPAESGRAYRDPLLPLHYSGDQPAAFGMMGFEVSGIIDVGGSRAALINGKVYQKNDAVDDFTIVDIHADGIEIKREEEVVFVPLYPGSKTQQGNAKEN